MVNMPRFGVRKERLAQSRARGALDLRNLGLNGAQWYGSDLCQTDERES